VVLSELDMKCLMDNLKRYRDKTGSSANSVQLASAATEFPHRAVTPDKIIDEFLPKFGESRENIISQFQDSFQSHKSLIKHFPPVSSAGRTELAHVHPVLKGIVQELVPRMLKDKGLEDKYDLNYEVGFDADLAGGSASLREKPDFTIKLKQRSNDGGVQMFRRYTVFYYLLNVNFLVKKSTVLLNQFII
jgi:hypothetical protein